MISYNKLRLVNILAIFLLPLAIYDWAEIGLFVLDVKNYYFVIFMIMFFSFFICQFFVLNNKNYSDIVIYMLNYQHNRSETYKRISSSFMFVFFTSFLFLMESFEVFVVVIFYWFSWPILICAWKQEDKI